MIPFELHSADLAKVTGLALSLLRFAKLGRLLTEQWQPASLENRLGDFLAVGVKAL